MPVFFKTSKVEANGKKELAYIRGVNEDFFKLRNVKAIAGRQFNLSENQSKAKVAVMGYSIAERLFGNPENAIGKVIRFDKQRFETIGVIGKTGHNEEDLGIVVPYKSTYGSINPDKTFWAINVGVESEKDIEIAKKRIKETLLKR